MCSLSSQTVPFRGRISPVAPDAQKAKSLTDLVQPTRPNYSTSEDSRVVRHG